MNIMIKLMLVTSITIAPHIMTDNSREAQKPANPENQEKQESAHKKPNNQPTAELLVIPAK